MGREVKESFYLVPGFFEPSLLDRFDTDFSLTMLDDEDGYDKCTYVCNS